MSIDKESSGLPGVNVKRSTTKVNLWMIAGIILFLAVATGVAIWTSQRAVDPAGASSSVIEPKS